MKLTGELKGKVEAVETKEEKKAIIADAGMELTDDELEAVAGGQINNKIVDSKPMIMDVICTCGTLNHVDICKSSYKCIGCGKVRVIGG